MGDPVGDLSWSPQAAQDVVTVDVDGHSDHKQKQTCVTDKQEVSDAHSDRKCAGGRHMTVDGYICFIKGEFKITCCLNCDACWLKCVHDDLDGFCSTFDVT